MIAFLTSVLMRREGWKLIIIVSILRMCIFSRNDPTQLFSLFCRKNGNCNCDGPIIYCVLFDLNLYISIILTCANNMNTV